MKGAKFARLTDKLNFILGVFLILSASYMLGRYPHDFWYHYHCIVFVSLVIIRLFNYRKKG